MQNSMFSANHSNDQMMTQILQHMQVMQEQISGSTLSNGANGQRRQNTTNRSSMTSKNGNTANDTNTNPRTGLPWKRYYWSCGWCGHWGKAFPNKKEGHQDDASFKNRMGGIRKYCPWQEWGAVCKTELGYSHNSNKNTNYIYSIFQKTVALHLEPPSSCN